MLGPAPGDSPPLLTWTPATRVGQTSKSASAVSGETHAQSRDPHNGQRRIGAARDEGCIDPQTRLNRAGPLANEKTTISMCLSLDLSVFNPGELL